MSRVSLYCVYFQMHTLYVYGVHNTHMQKPMCIHLHIHIHICAQIYTYIYSKHVWIYIHIYIYIDTHTYHSLLLPLAPRPDPAKEKNAKPQTKADGRRATAQTPGRIQNVGVPE